MTKCHFEERKVAATTDTKGLTNEYYNLGEWRSGSAVDS